MPTASPTERSRRQSMSVGAPKILPMRFCQACGAALSKRSQKIYCGNACQAAARRSASPKLWLEFGEAKFAASAEITSGATLRLNRQGAARFAVDPPCGPAYR